MKHWLVVMVCVAVLWCAPAFAQHRVLAVGMDRLVIFSPAGEEEWSMPWPRGLHDLHVLPSGNLLAVRDAREVCEIDRNTKQVVWHYNAAERNGNAGQRVEVHACQPLPNGGVMIAESGPGRIIEIDREGTLRRVVKLKVDRPDPHRDTRLARKLDNGNYLVCHEGDGVVREYAGGDGAVVWEYPVPLFGKAPASGHGPEAFGNQIFSALRLKNGNTLIGLGNGHGVIEVSPAKEIVWELHQNDLPGITLAWVTTLEVLPNGHIVLGNCHAGPGQPQIVEVAYPKREAVWTFEHFEVMGNDLTNSALIDLAGKTLR